MNDPSAASNGRLQVRTASYSALGIIAATYFGAQQIQALGGLADGYTNLHNRLRVVTNTSEELNDVSEQLFEVSNRSRVSWQATAQIFQRTAASSKELGVSFRELTSFTESLNQAVIISGATSAEASNALIQLSQGLASATLRGDELRSVLEQLPFVARVIADHLGVTIGQLRMLGAQGRITAKSILEAFRETREEIEARFLRLTPTISQSFAVLQNNILRYIGEANEASGVTAALSRVIFGLANNLNLAVSAGQTLGLALLVALASRAIPAVDCRSSML